MMIYNPGFGFQGLGFGAKGVSGFGFFGWPSGLNPFTEVQYRERDTQLMADGVSRSPGGFRACARMGVGLVPFS